MINGPNTGAGGASLVQARARKINKAIMKAVEVVELGIDVDEEEEEEGEEEEDGGDDIRTVLSEAEGGGINKVSISGLCIIELLDRLLSVLHQRILSY